MKQNYKQMANALRFLSADMIDKANSGHPGMPLGMADVATVLFSKFLKTNPKDPKWFNRDRFILSAGHGSALLYSLQYYMGYHDISLDDIKSFRQLGSKCAGHPEYGHLDGVDMTTGPLGQGISSAVGFAVAERILNANYGDLCNHFTYVICGDGCLQEGISEEAIAMAGHLGLSKLIVFWDNNNITIDGYVSSSSSTNQLKRFKANNWNTIAIDGHEYKEIEKAIKKAQKSKKPTLIACKTKIGFGAPNKQGTNKCHGSPLGEVELKAMRESLNWNYGSFEIPQEIKVEWEAAGAKSAFEYELWQKESKKNKAFLNQINNVVPASVAEGLKELKEKAIAEKMNVATRKASQLCLEKIVPNLPSIIGGSADLIASNLTFVDGMKTVKRGDFKGNNIAYGIREHVMGAMLNGLSLHGGFIPYGGTFFVFSDYLRPAQRLAALMGIRVVYVLTHDSIGVGEDGPTHQPVEHLASYRAMPNINVFRPCDVVETAEAWQFAIENECSPSILALSRQNLPTLRVDAKENLTSKGAYIISPASNPVATLIATGSEVALAINAQKELKVENIDVNVVSMPCMELFEKQDDGYQSSILGNCPRIAIEAGAKFGWERYANDIIGLDGFGASGPAGEVYEYCGVNLIEVIDAVKNCLTKKGK
ncbi:MAG: transketolase [Alphaproteobacteria bacterium]